MATRSRTSPRARGTGRQAVLLCPKEAKERGVSRLRFVLALVAAAMVAVVVTASLANATPSDTRSVAALCKAALQGQLSSEDREWAERCVRVLTEGRKQGKPTPTPTTSTPNPEPTTPTAKPPAPTTPPPPAPVPGGFPNAANTGVPTGTALTAYTGSCVITAPNTVIDAKIANCDLVIRTTGVQIRRSKVNGTVSTADGPRLATGVGADNFTVLRSEIIGGNRGIYCRRACEVRDSWVHGTQVASSWHASGIRASQGSKIIHNTIACDTRPTPEDGGCSAPLTMYGDFEAVRDVLVQNNLFVASIWAAFCAYGGSSGGKPFSGAAANVVFLDNTFQRGTNGKCGAYAPIDAFDPSRPGNRWSGNVWQGSTEPVRP